MLRTIIVDAYRENEKARIVEALDMLCDPCDNHGWASAGIYCYWDYKSREILYVGLAVDLKERFKQHNGFYSSIDPNACKKKQIDDYFKGNEKIGFSIVVQSCLSQPATKSVELQFQGLFERIPLARKIGKHGKDGIQRMEGVLIEAYKQANGNFPKWNRVGGSVRGQLAVRKANYEAFSLLSASSNHYLLSRSTLREIALDPKLERYENFLHAARMLAPLCGFNKACQLIAATDIFGTMRHIDAEGYLNKQLLV